MDGDTYYLPITLTLSKDVPKEIESSIEERSNVHNKVGKSKSFNGKSGEISRPSNRLLGTRSISSTSLGSLISPWSITEAKEEIQNLHVVKTLTNFTNGYAGGIMNYLSTTKDRSATSQGSIFSPWSLFDNVNEQYNLHANQEELD